MANVEKLRETLAELKRNLHRWEQKRFVRGVVNPDAKDYHECGTTFCFGGLRCLMDGLRPMYYVDDFGDPTQEATGCFYWPTASDESINGWDHAEKSFDLAPSEAYALFMFITDNIDKFEQRVEAIIRGEFR